MDPFEQFKEYKTPDDKPFHPYICQNLNSDILGDSEIPFFNRDEIIKRIYEQLTELNVNNSQNKEINTTPRKRRKFVLKVNDVVTGISGDDWKLLESVGNWPRYDPKLP